VPQETTTRAPLEDNLQRELRVEGFSGTDSWGVIASADGGANLTEASRSRVGIAKLGRAGIGQVETVGDVEHLDAELRAYAFRDGSVLEDRKISIRKTRTVKAIALEVAPGSGRRIFEGSWIEPLHEAGAIDVLHLVADACEGVSHLVRTLRVLVCA
jgi:hypothetical protein